MNTVYSLYSNLFAKKTFYRMNKILYRLAAHGLGLWNFPQLTGEKQFIHNCVKTDGAITVFDVGANVGIYSAEIKSACPNAVIYAFEPHPATFAKLSELFKHTGYARDKAVNVGMGREAGIFQLFDYSNITGGGVVDMHPFIKKYLKGYNPVFVT